MYATTIILSIAYELNKLNSMHVPADLGSSRVVRVSLTVTYEFTHKKPTVSINKGPKTSYARTSGHCP